MFCCNTIFFSILVAGKFTWDRWGRRYYRFWWYFPGATKFKSNHSEYWKSILGDLDIFFSTNHNIHKFIHSSSLCFLTSDPQRLLELLWMLWFDEKNISNAHIFSEYTRLLKSSLIILLVTQKNFKIFQQKTAITI